MDEAIANHFVDKLQAAGYEHIFRKRPTDLKADGCVVAWKKSRFMMKAGAKTTELNTSAVKNTLISKAHVKEYIRNNIILNVLLQDVSFNSSNFLNLPTPPPNPKLTFLLDSNR